MHFKSNYVDIDNQILEIDKIRESYIHDLIQKNLNIQDDIKRILNIEDSTLELIHEDRYINGIIADFTLLSNQKIRAIVECKAGDIGVTDFVRGIGQVMQYEYFFEQNISKGYQYHDVFNTILVIPSSVVKNNLFNLGRFKYPHTTILLEINDTNSVTREITSSELEKVGSALDMNLTTISQYYVRDNRLFELYMLLKYLCYKKIKGVTRIERKYEEENNLTKLNTPNNQNWRNAFISLSSFGFIDRNNIPTPSGLRLGYLDFEEFCLMMYKSYLKPYIDKLSQYFEEDTLNLEKSNIEISEDLVKNNNNKDILFLTQSNGRYISSWLNIMRDDFGILEFTPRSKSRILKYNPIILNDEHLKNTIKQFSKGYDYLDNFALII